MSDNMVIKTSKMIYPQIYAYTLPTFPSDKGWIQIGYTKRKNIDDFIKGQTKTAAINLDYLKLLSEPTKFSTSDDWFKDKQIHAYFRKHKNVEQRSNTEWFFYNKTLEKAYDYFDDKCVELFGKKI